MEIDYDTHLKPATQIKKEKGEDAAIEFLFKLYDGSPWGLVDKYAILERARGYYKKAKNPDFKTRIEKELISLSQSFPDNNINKCSVYEALVKLNQTKGDSEQAYYMTNGALSSVHPEDTAYCLRMYQLMAYKVGYLASKDIKQFKYAGDYFYWSLVADLYRHCWYNYVAINPQTEKQLKEEKEIVKGTIWPFEYDHHLLIAFLTLANGKSVQEESKKIQNLFFEEFPKRWDKRKHQTQIVGLSDELINGYLKELAGL